MLIKTASGNVTINKKSAYGKWLLGWIKGNGFNRRYRSVIKE